MDSQNSLDERKQEDLEELRQIATPVRTVISRYIHRDIKRVKAFAALIGEREYQESLHKKTGQDPISVEGELALLKVYLDKAFAVYAETFGDPGEKPTMDVIRKITAIGLRALENYGCPLRDIEGSLAARPPEHKAMPKPPANELLKEGDETRRGVYL